MDELIAQYLREGVEQAEISYRTLAADTGMSVNRIGIILRQEPPPATIGELSRLASAIGLTASGLMTRAEEELARRIPDDRPSTEVAAATAEFVDELWKQIADTFGTADAFRTALVSAGHHQAADRLNAYLEGSEVPSQEDLTIWLGALHRAGQREQFDLVANDTINEQYDVSDSNFDNA